MLTTTVSTASSSCIACGAEAGAAGGSGESANRRVSVPNFGEVHIATFSCDACGYAYNRVFAATDADGWKPEGTRTVLKCLFPADLRREVIRSDFCSMEVPEASCYLRASEGRLTTIEGLLSSLSASFENLVMIKDGDEAGKRVDLAARLANLISDVEAGKEGSGFTVILEDPSGRSFVGPPPGNEDGAANEKDDPRLTHETFERTDAQNADLGIATSQDNDDTKNVPPSAASPSTAAGETSISATSATAYEMMQFLNAMAGGGEYLDDDGY